MTFRLKIVKSEAEKYYKSHTPDDCFNTGMELYQSDNFQIQEVGVFLLGYAAHCNAAVSGLREDDSEYVRKSIGNALRDIDKK